ncbi:MAG: site-specific DNA-methyltransferase [Syntrophales bacterium]
MTTSDRKIYSDPLVTLYQGDSLEVLKGLPAESVDMVMTSPPYYGLRSYKAEPVIWDNHNGCQHEWGDGKEHLLNMKSGNPEFSRPWREGATATVSSGNFCLLCSAWRGQLGSEPTPDLFIKHLCDIFDEVKRVLKKTGTIYVNIDDSHSGSWGNMSHTFNDKEYPEGRPPQSFNQGVPAKSLIGIPERFVLEMLNRGWIRRNTIIWKKDSVMPESVKDRFTIDFEYVYMFSKSKHYFFEQQFEPATTPPDFVFRTDKARITGTTQETGNYFKKGGYKEYEAEHGHYYNGQRNRRTTWTINPQGFKGAHYATYPEELCRTPIEASCPEDGIVLDPFSGVATTAVMAKKLGRRAIGIEISEKYHQMAIKRIQNTTARMV